MSNSSHRLGRPWVGFVIAFVGLLAGFRLLATLVQPPLNSAVASLAAHGLDLLGAEGRADGPLVRSSLTDVTIIWECTGVLPCLVFTAGVLAFPSGWKAKLWGLGLGVPLIFTVNLARVIGLVYAATHWPGRFDTIHVLISQPLILLTTLLLWLGWVVRIAQRGRA